MTKAELRFLRVLRIGTSLMRLILMIVRSVLEKSNFKLSCRAEVEASNSKMLTVSKF